MTDQTGQLFTHLYCERTEPTLDDDVLRCRLGAYLQSTTWKDHSELSTHLRVEAGLQVPMTGAYYHFETFMQQRTTFELLNCITHVWRFLQKRHGVYRGPNDSATRLAAALDKSRGLSALPVKTGIVSDSADAWQSFVARVFREQNVAYRIDDQGGVHPLVDREFEHSRESLVRGLSDPKFAAVRAALEEAHRALGIEHRNTKTAVRSMFEALEILSKLLAPAITRLNDAAVKKELLPIVRDRYASDSVASASALQMMDAFAKWVNSVHIYRHGQGTQDPVAPPMDFGVYVVSSGAAWLRFLLDLSRPQAKQ